MKNHKIVFLFLILSTLFITATQALALEPIELPAPDKAGGKPLMQALELRQSKRAFSLQELPIQTLSNLLWAATGKNRDDGKMTAPTAGDSREIDIYVALGSGLYQYHVDEHKLHPVIEDDLRELTGVQDITQQAPVNLIYVADLSRIPFGKENDFYAAVDTGFVSQNVYLYCASEGLSTVVLGWIERDVLAQKMGLSDTQKIILSQPVGLPAAK